MSRQRVVIAADSHTAIGMIRLVVFRAQESFCLVSRHVHCEPSFIFVVHDGFGVDSRLNEPLEVRKVSNCYAQIALEIPVKSHLLSGRAEFELLQISVSLTSLTVLIVSSAGAKMLCTSSLERC